MENSDSNALLEFQDGSKVWFTSDLHIGHKNILSFTKRPFNDLDDMRNEIIKRWNSVVKEDDTVFLLGDIAWGKSTDWDILNSLNGEKYLIFGNHDIKNWRKGYSKYFKGTYFQINIIVEGRSIYLNHYPFLAYGGMHREWNRSVWQLHGHVHSGPNLYGGEDIPILAHASHYQYDVGVDNNNFTPISFKQIEEKIKSQYEEYIKTPKFLKKLKRKFDLFLYRIKH